MSPLRVKHVLVFLFLLGASLRTIDVWRPVDGTSLSSWHEGDTASIARNYYREGMNLLYPRIDWRGNGPGYAEMEFPLFPWLAAAAYRLIGVQEVVLRLLPFAFSLVGMGVFFHLAHRLLPAPGSAVACAFFAIHPLLVAMSRSIQPEPLMLAFYVVAVYAFLRWLEDRKPLHYALAIVATALAVLLKAPAAHVGFLFLALVCHRKGWHAFKEPALWLFAALSLAPGILWYTHARGLWLTYGNSLGVSNESHWVGWDLFQNPYFITGVLRIELRFWTLAGLLVSLWGVWASQRTPLREPARVALYWLASAFLFYVVTARTSADQWASYYHVFSIPAMALLVGTGAASVAPALSRLRNRSMIVLIAAFAAGAAFLLPLDDMDRFASDTAIRALFASGALAVSILSLTAGRERSLTGNSRGEAQVSASLMIAAVVAGLTTVTFFWQSRRLIWDLDDRSEQQSNYECVPAVREALTEPGLILASGASCTDQAGKPVAYNDPGWFYWLDRKGFNICDAEQSVEEVRKYADLGAAYFVANDFNVGRKAGFEQDLRAAFPAVYEGCRAVVYRLP
jgi:4-amino-4-deoxy-L-arabinose transferase-like glycosyltransferase